MLALCGSSCTVQNITNFVRAGNKKNDGRSTWSSRTRTVSWNGRKTTGLRQLSLVLVQWVSMRNVRTVEALKGGVNDALKLIRASVARARVTAMACSSCVRPSSSASSLSSSLSSFAITDVIIRQGSRAMAAGRHTAVLIQHGRGRQRLANSTVTYSINRAAARHFLTGCRPNYARPME